MAASKQETPTSEVVQFKARLRWLRLETPKPFEDGAKPRWEATFIIDPTDKLGLEGITRILTVAGNLAKAEYGVTPLAIKKLAGKFIPGAQKPDLNDPKNAEDGIKVPFFDGDTKEQDSYKGMFILPAHNSKLKPRVVNPNAVTVQPGDPGYPYDGCYGKGSVTFWIQVGLTQQKYGKRVGVNLRGVQFIADGEPFSSDAVSEDEFQALEDAAPAASQDW